MNKYPDDDTRRILEWIDAVNDIDKGDETTLPRLLQEAETKTLMGVYEQYDGALEDYRKHGPEIAHWSEWDDAVMNGVRQELRRRGISPLSGELGEWMGPA
jgi:hypothetical protein